MYTLYMYKIIYITDHTHLSTNTKHQEKCTEYKAIKLENKSRKKINLRITFNFYIKIALHSASSTC